MSSNGTFLSGANGFTGPGLTGGGVLAIDGGGNVWISNSTGSTPVNGVPPNTALMVELSNSGAVLWVSGYILPGSSVGITVDGSGNVWAAGASGTISEFIGVATPVVTPLSLGIKNGALATRP